MRKRAIIPFVIALILTAVVVVLIYITAPIGLAGAGYMESDIFDVDDPDDMLAAFAEYLMLLAPIVVISLIAIIFYVAAPVRSRYGFVRHASRLLILLHIAAVALLAVWLVQFLQYFQL